jgi:hypothetical protein
MFAKIIYPFIFCILLTNNITAQKITSRLNDIKLDNLEGFESASENWKIVGDIQGKYDSESLNPSKGSGILYNNFKKEIQFKEGRNLFTKFNHGDIYLELDIMVAEGANSGIYFQSRYEVQILDSWNSKGLTSSDMGGIYERWKDDKGFEGSAPLKNASLAPGLWQHMEISFQAPRFDATGKKTMNAKFNFIKLNGIILHENIFVTGPTRSSAAADEKSLAPIMFQGDHGVVAFKNIRYALLEDLNVTTSAISYKYYERNIKTPAEAIKLKPTAEGKTKSINPRLAAVEDGFLLQFEGLINIPTTDTYLFTSYSGVGSLEIDGIGVIKPTSTRVGGETVDGSIHLEKGEHHFNLWVNKNRGRAKNGLTLFIEKPNSKATPLHNPSSLTEATSPLITVKTQKEPEIIRSFLFHKNKKLTHVISVGDLAQVNYSYNLLQGALLQVWKTDFLNVTDMWYQRGEPQIATPMGSTIVLAGNCPIYDKTNVIDSISGYQYKGYTLTESRLPVYSYAYKELFIKDMISPFEQGRGLNRTISLTGKGIEDAMIRIAQAKTITLVGKGLYAIDNQSYYVQVSPALFPKIETYNNQQVLLLPASKEITYQIIW